MEIYNKLKTPPKDALKTIDVGKLKGKSDINPQWKIERMTEVFGECGQGWWFEITDRVMHECPGGEVLLFLTVALYTKVGDEVSKPVFGCGGDFVIQRNKNGLVPNDEAYKMCLTDALGNAMKNLGVAADVYRGLFNDSKYARQESYAREEANDAYSKRHKDNKTAVNEAIGNVVKATSMENAKPLTKKELEEVDNLLATKVVDEDKFWMYIDQTYHVDDVSALKREQFNDVISMLKRKPDK